MYFKYVSSIKGFFITKTTGNCLNMIGYDTKGLIGAFQKRSHSKIIIKSNQHCHLRFVRCQIHHFTFFSVAAAVFDGNFWTRLIVSEL